MVGGAVVVASAGLIVLAASTDVPPWAQYGILGVLVVAFIIQQIVPGALWKAERTRADNYEALFREKVLPLVGQSTEVLGEVVDLLKSLKTERDVQLREQDVHIRGLLEELLDQRNELIKKGVKKSAVARKGGTR